MPVDAELAVSRLGPPLRTEIAHWFPPEQVESAVRVYRELYPAYAITPTVLLPGAREAIDAVRARGGRVLVVTSKIGRLARLHLDHLGLAVDELAGDLFAEQKATALREHGATHYVGDHVADMVAAAAAGVPGIGVATGPCSADELRAAGAEVVLDDLTEFPAALDGDDPASLGAVAAQVKQGFSGAYGSSEVVRHGQGIRLRHQ